MASLHQARAGLSLSGISQYLVALGGFTDHTQATSEIYSLRTNKWRDLACLKTARSRPGSCVLPSMRAYCFFGLQEGNKDSRIIQTQQLFRDRAWTTLSLERKAEASNDLCALSCGGKILVFGGTSKENKTMQKFSEEGKLIGEETKH